MYGGINQSPLIALLGGPEYGNQSGGSVTFDGTTTILGLVPSSGAYTLTADVAINVATVNAPVICNGFVFHCWELKGSSVITGKSNAASLGVAGAIINATGTLATAAGNGGTGVTTTTAGNGGAGSGGRNMGGSSGAGGQGDGGNAGGAGNSSAAPTAVQGNINSSTFAINRRLSDGTSANGGGGGGSGGANIGTGTATSGAGGSGAIGCLVFARTLNWTGTIHADGGAGGNAASTGNGKAGGGGGGAGGWVEVVSSLVLAQGTIRANGGAKGTGIGGGSDGVDGTTGTVVKLFRTGP